MFKEIILAAGCVFDLPTQAGVDSAHREAEQSHPNREIARV